VRALLVSPESRRGARRKGTADRRCWTARVSCTRRRKNFKDAPRGQHTARRRSCFHTSLTGYQEVFTDPSYAGQIVCLTYPHIGNVGTNLDDEESTIPHIESLVVREFSSVASNWRSGESAQEYLTRHDIPVLWDVDTRALVRHIRQMGALRGVVSTDGLQSLCL